ncbi:unnamed protein product [Brachionus calyciflorus]|uniref:SWIM-type domain-containing protein n=1 Tax=Brachionus calyciflorus TaxID=104777 RepID=A0A814C7E7_9BILA|nr:unnamed protein product [Brachionus calyciflorus]
MVSLKKIRTACSSHHICFVCLKKASKKNRLSRINFKTILHGYYQHQLLIKRTSRCCRNHLDENRQLRIDLYSLIPTSIQEHDSQIFEIFDYHRNHETSIFENFKDFSQLDEKHCLKITGWGKDKFLRFSNFITSINDNSNRTKDQLIALYRYWLSTGSSQKVLASLFGSKTSQVQISNYLSEIRTAIYKDFVPFFLGSKKKRNFFLRHSNKMVDKLLKLKDDEMAIICDGTYTRLEKSSNNEFQYRCWSVQKTDSLIKPFIICCPDGWIIDCYGPFQASENDASILKYILKIDNDLKDILIPKKTVIFLDRGFRDILSLLKDDYKFDCKIPTCQQLEPKKDKPDSKSRQLTVKQTSDTKIVTKCRFMVEKQIGMLKNNKALDNIRNTEAGHIMIDYRICCSMINFDLKPSCPDGENAEKIATKILIRSQKKENDLEFLLGKHLDTKSICPISFSEILDFPVLKRKSMKNNIFLGSYQFNQAKSYLIDLIKNKNAFLVQNNIIKKHISKESQNMKIISIELPSRHKRSKKRESSKNNIFSKSFRNTYKVFVQYVPYLNNSKGIKAYICSCLSGKKVVGCCSHVAALIYYLGYAKYREMIFPADGLNKIFIDMENKESPNKPRYFRNKRRKIKESSSESDSESDSGSDSKSIYTEIVNPSKENQLDKKKQNKSKCMNSKNLQNQTFEAQQKTFHEIQENDPKPNLQNEDLLSSVPNNHNSITIPESKENEARTSFQNNSLENNLQDFINHVPKWSATINYRNINNVYLRDTCTIDYHLIGLWFYLKKLNPEFFANKESNDNFKETLEEIILKIDKNEWNVARELWVNDILKDDILPTKRRTRFQISLFGSEFEFFIRFLVKYQMHEVLQSCNEFCYKNKQYIISNNSENIYFLKEKGQVELYSFYRDNCNECGKKIQPQIKFKNKTHFLYIESLTNDILVKDLPKEIKIENQTFKFFYSTIHNSGHFLGIFDFGSDLLGVDDIGQKVNILESLDQSLTNENTNKFYFEAQTTISFYFLNEN